MKETAIGLGVLAAVAFVCYCIGYAVRFVWPAAIPEDAPAIIMLGCIGLMVLLLLACVGIIANLIGQIFTGRF